MTNMLISGLTNRVSLRRYLCSGNLFENNPYFCHF